jgi:chondroitin 4-sulfotransferase 11
MKYLYQTDNNLQYVYFITPKCATRTFFNLFNYNPVKYRKFISEYNDYFSWTFVRNPWDRLVSTYFNKIVNHFQSGMESFRGISFEEFVVELEKTDVIDSKCDRHIRSLHTLFPSNINFIGRFENLQEDFNMVCDKIGIPQQELPQKNKGKHKHYTEYYDDETREIVAEKYAKDIEYFGYKFEE